VAIEEAEVAAVCLVQAEPRRARLQLEARARRQRARLPQQARRQRALLPQQARHRRLVHKPPRARRAAPGVVAVVVGEVAREVAVAGARARRTPTAR
jgi:hypothetical protein